ncbi:AT-hook motif nuclear-localized protein 1 [Camellia lanceoleosa]|uniref:AT-hook motif nuclear-localized protein 1 n=1 Tax=Camellia lanceoleosa TaxID=1840588 RepID=A0ACC0HTI2_9ERIC|nr:AT-hook motif nuclear-localized protein 1 [Camellia lanceoleosa]
MTAPVITQSLSAEKIAMTAPVVMKGGGEEVERKLVTMQFILPSKYKKAEEASRPVDERVVIREERERKYGVVKFGGAETEVVVRKSIGLPDRPWRLLLAGELSANTAGVDFTPHVVTVYTGEDVAAKILSFSQKGPPGICVLSANGTVSNVTIRQPGSSGDVLTYEVSQPATVPPSSTVESMMS